jgi:hypothetical protein
VSLGPAEICHDAVTEVLGDVAAESSDRLSRGTMVPGNYLAPFFRVELSGDLSRAHQITE